MLTDDDQIIATDSGAFACFTLDGQLLWQQSELRSPGAKGPFGFPGNVLAPDFFAMTRGASRYSMIGSH